MSRLSALSLAAVAVFLGGSAVASASTLIARNASQIRLAVSASGKALLTFTVDGRIRHDLVWGAINARLPNPNVRQVKLKIDYTGGGEEVWSRFENQCRQYDGPPLPYRVAACKASDGSYWAVQSWQYWLPLLGFTPWRTYQSDWAFHISHWRGPLAELNVWTDWLSSSRSAPRHIFGLLSYRGVPVHGFSTTTRGAPTDGFGRVVYIDTLGSADGSGWKREIGMVARNPSGVFCHAFTARRPPSWYPNRHTRPPGYGKRYRVTVEGPGVTPDVMVEVADPGTFDRNDRVKVQRERKANAVLDRIAATAKPCLRY